VLTLGDYALWDWSIAGGRDVLALASGLTLIPLAAATLALVALGAARLSAALLGRTRGRDLAHTGATRGSRSRRRARKRPAGQTRPSPSRAAATERASERDSRRLAA